MATPNANQSNSDSTSIYNEVVYNANQKFIDSANVLIANAIQLGKFEINLSPIKPMNLQYIQNYFTQLGYNISIPNQLYTNNQPAELFGEFWVDFWLKSTFLDYNKTDFLINISWKKVI